MQYRPTVEIVNSINFYSAHKNEVAGTSLTRTNR